MTTLQALVDELKDRAPLDRELREMARLLSTAGASWAVPRPLVARANAYTRTSVHREGRFEVVLLNWAAGAFSGIHDHGGRHCWMSVLEGSLLVDDYARLDRGERAGYARIEARDSRLLGTGELDLRSGPFDLHRVGATADAPAISLHVYAAPLQEYGVYDELSERCQTALGTYDDVLDDPRRLVPVR
ncbi:MAG TPA: cysteine dioxygenase family protein [Candidatus Cybelea sp.]|jgi:cysteine dioxygenase|nr:cysteine dioxygenase family protein [Candidatus Cybelea sp.]